MTDSSMSVVSHKGYQAQLVVDVEDNVIYGRVIGLERDQISFHAESVNGAKAEFEATIDEYLRDCAADGVEAETPKVLVDAA
ncbi:MAG: hypothetical protein WBA76_19200 [Phormidesmis sp.]